MDKISLSEASAITAISDRRLREFCVEGKIKNAELISGQIWLIPLQWAEDRRIADDSRDIEGFVSLAEATRKAGVSREAMLRAAERGEIISYSRLVDQRHRWFIKTNDESFTRYIEKAQARSAHRKNRRNER